MSAKKLHQLGIGDIWVDLDEVIAVHPNPQYPRGCLIQLSNGVALGVTDMTVATIVNLLPVPR